MMSTMQITVVVLVLVSAVVVHAIKLPSWITACYRDDPEFNACAMKNGQACIKRLVQGDRKLQIPVLDPLSISELRVDKDANSLGLDLVFNDMKLVGLGGTKMTKYHMDFDTKHISCTLFLTHFEIVSMYNITGKIFVLPITGSGPSNMTFEGVTITLNFDYELNKKNGKEYMTFLNDKITFDTTHVIFKLDNLFNGDKFLGDNMNAFLNERWRDLMRELSPTIAGAIGSVVMQIANGMSQQISFDDLVPLSSQQ